MQLTLDVLRRVSYSQPAVSWATSATVSPFTALVTVFSVVINPFCFNSQWTLRCQCVDVPFSVSCSHHPLMVTIHLKPSDLDRQDQHSKFYHLCRLNDTSLHSGEEVLHLDLKATRLQNLPAGPALNPHSPFHSQWPANGHWCPSVRPSGVKVTVFNKGTPPPPRPPLSLPCVNEGDESDKLVKTKSLRSLGLFYVELEFGIAHSCPTVTESKQVWILYSVFAKIEGARLFYTQ